MPVCARAVQQADGTLVLALDPTTQDLSTCAYVVDDGASNAWRELGNMSIEDAHTIGVGVGAVWAVCFTFRALIRALNLRTEREET
jgi:hypothetical protein